MGTDILQLILIGNVFILGAVVAVGVRAYLDHKHPRTHSGIMNTELTSQLGEDAERAMKSAFEAASASLTNNLNTTASDLNRELASFGSSIIEEEMRLFRDNLERIRAKTEREVGSTHGQIAARQSTLEVELAQRRNELEQHLAAQQHTLESSLTQLQSNIERTLGQRKQAFASAQSEREKSLDASLDEEIAKERAALITRIDTRLNDAMSSFLLETLGSDIDLGAQMPYILRQLESQKDELKKEVGEP